MRFKDMKLHFLLIIFLFISFSTYVYSSRAALNNQARNTTSDQDFSFEEDPEGPAVKRLQPPYLQLPIFLHSRIPLVDKEQFSPKVGLGFEQVPEELKKLFFPRAPLTERASSRRRGRAQGVHVVCQLTKMIVKVNKHILGVGGVQYELKLGTCDISKTTKNHHVFIYDMDQCASERKLINNRVTYSNILHYSPVMDQGPIRRSVPFSIPVECHFNRYHYSYKIGYIPQVRHQHHFKPLRAVDSVVLTPRDEQWRRLSPTQEYTIGHPMYFQADGPHLAEDERLFVDSCYVTVSRSHLSMPRFTVIENNGCMTESKSTRWSRFIQSGQRNVVRFSLDAFLFHGMLGKHLYMHCEISIGSLIPTATAKSCTYNQNTKQWEELHSSNNVCFCCDSTCQSYDLSVSSKVFTSDPWIMESDLGFVEEEETTLFTPDEVGTGYVQVLTSAETDSQHFVPVSTVVEKKDKFVEPRRIFEEVFGLD